MNLKDMIDTLGDDVGDIVFSNTVECGHCKIRVSGTVPKKAEPFVTISMDAFEMWGSTHEFTALFWALERVLRAIDETTEGSR